MAKLSTKTVAYTIVGGYIHIILPDGSGGWDSRRILLSDFVGDSNVHSFTDLDDVINTYTGNQFKILRVNAEETELEAVDPELIFAGMIHNADEKTTPVDADEFGLWDSVVSLIKRLTWANLKATLKVYFDSLYAPLRPTTEKTTLVDADEVTGNNSANSFSQIRTTWTNVKAFLKTYFDTLYFSLINLRTTWQTTPDNTHIASEKLTKDSFNILDNYTGNGIIEGFTISINADTTKIDISSGTGYIINNYTDPANPVRTLIDYAGQTGIVLTYLATNLVTYLALDSSSTVIQQTSMFTATQRRDYIILGVAVHSNKTIVNAINNLPDVILDGHNQFNDLLDSLRNFNKEGNVFSANGANLKLNKNIGKIFKKGVNFGTDNKNPHIKELAALVAPANMRHRLSDGTEYSDTDVVELNYESAPGVKSAIGGGYFTIHRINIFSSNLVRIQLGQTRYGTLALARQSLLIDPFTVEANIAENALLRAYLIIAGNATDLTDTNKAIFIEADKFGTMPIGSSGGVTTMQQAYDNSVIPQIVTTTGSGAVTIKRGSAADTDVVFDIQNGAGLSKLSIYGNGNISSIATDNILTTNLQSDKAEIDKLILGFTTQATAGGTTTLTVTSKHTQEFTGTLDEIISMPVVSTLTTGREFVLINTSTGELTVNSSGGNLITTIAAGMTAILKCVLITGTGANSWSVFSNGDSIVASEVTNVGSGETYTTIYAAKEAGKYNLLITSDITENAVSNTNYNLTHIKIEGRLKADGTRYTVDWTTNLFSTTASLINYCVLENIIFSHSSTIPTPFMNGCTNTATVQLTNVRFNTPSVVTTGAPTYINLNNVIGEQIYVNNANVTTITTTLSGVMDGVTINGGGTSCQNCLVLAGSISNVYITGTYRWFISAEWALSVSSKTIVTNILHTATNGMISFAGSGSKLNGCTNNVKLYLINYNNNEISNFTGNVDIYIGSSSSNIKFENCVINSWTQGAQTLTRWVFEKCTFNIIPSTATGIFVKCVANNCTFAGATITNRWTYRNCTFSTLTNINDALAAGSDTYIRFYDCAFTLAVDLNTSYAIIKTSEFASTLRIAGDYCKINENIITGLFTLLSGAEYNTVIGNTLTAGYTDSSGSSTNVIDLNI